MNKCSKCFTIKSVDCFYTLKTGKLNKRCKQCISEQSKQKSEQRKLNFVPLLEKCCVNCEILKPIVNFYSNYYSNDCYSEFCRDCNKERSSKFYKENQEEYKNIAKQYYYKEKDTKEYKQKRKERKKKRIKNDPKFHLMETMRTRVSTVLRTRGKKKCRKTMDLVGCTAEELMLYLENKFKQGMSWENRGFYGWHIDHIIPLSSAKTEEELMKLFHYTNLQPLWSHENLSKGTKIIEVNFE